MVAQSLWQKINEANPPTPKMIEELKTLCLDLGKKGWTVLPRLVFLGELQANKTSPPDATLPAARSTL
jgi:hypothetical protein